MYDPSEALLQLGLYDYVWGDPGLLNTYNSNVQAEKARQENLAYQNMWKQIEQNKINAENAKAEEQARKDKEAKLADLYKQYNNAAGEQERALIRRQINALEGSDAVRNEMLDAYDADKLAAKVAEEDEAWRHTEALKEMAKINSIIRTAKTPVLKEKIAQSIYDKTKYPNMNSTERDKMYADIMGIKTLGEKIKESNEGAIASHSAKKTGEQLSDKDLTDKAQKAISSNSSPSSLSDDVKAKIRELGYSWNGTNWYKR